ncbi:MAG TPA: ATP-binding cassette domain-containing protein [Gammaproteobacteria bacterium]|nr:ATP-binding cassette domain-containing protein [Gammaproteobacteria bacterium]
MALLRLQNIHLSFGLPPLLDGVEFSLERGERVALVGRNGEGKSTLMKIISGEVKPDDGEIYLQQGARIARLEQEVPRDIDGTVYDVVADGLGNLGSVIAQYHHITQDFDKPGAMDEMARLQQKIEEVDGWSMEQRIGTTISRLQLPADAEVATLSGGLKRRVLLARALVSDPDILLLDEPSNHLDVESIEWLESFLLSSGLTLIFVTHDRSFLRKLATRIVEIDRGKLSSWPGSYEAYLKGKAEALHAEEKQQAEFDKKLAREEVWIRQGIKARRTRNEGRVRALEQMRRERAQRREKIGKANIQANVKENSGKIVIEADHIAYAYENKPVIRDFSTTILRGDKIGIIGPNGAGKSTLLNLLLGKLQPQSGKIKIGTNLEIAYFDQLRETLNTEQTAQENVAGGSDQIIINGNPRHVISYLQDFLFSPERARAPITKLSGGEKNRLLLAKLFSQPANMLVLDEPTNDLDVETLELLEELLVDFSGTVLLVSHDREFLDNVVTSTFVFEGDGVVNEYIGGYQDWLRQRPESEAQQGETGKKKEKESKPRAPAKKLSYRDQRELDSLPKTIESLEARQEALHAQLGDPDFYKQEQDKVAAVTSEQEKVEKELEAAYQRWEELEGKQ